MCRRPAEQSSHGSQLVFDGDEKNCELWEATFLGYLHLQGLKVTILTNEDEENESEEEEPSEDAAKNAEAYVVLIQFLDDKSLLLVMWQAMDNRQKALKIPRNYYVEKGAPCVISLNTELTSLQN